MDGMENCLSPAAQDLAEARLAAKRAARAEAREIRMKELERQQKEVEERPDKDFNDKGARTASSLSAATLASLGGTSSRRGSGDTSISVDTEASIREIKDSLAEVEEKYKKAMVSNAQLDNEKTNFMYQVDTLKDVLLELEEQLAETHRQYEEKSKEFEREKHSHRILQIQYNELKESLQQRDELLTRHGIVLSSDLSPNGGILDGPLHESLVQSSTNAAPVSKTGDGPLGIASEVKRKSETAEEGQSVQSSKTECTEDAGVQSSANVHTEKTSLLSQRPEEDECSTGSSVGQACISADGQTDSVTNAGEQVAKTDPLHNGDRINGSGMGRDASTVTNQAANGSSETTAGHVEKTDTLQTERDVAIKGSMGNPVGEVACERATYSENESPCEVFKDAVEFASEQNISTEKELHSRDTCSVATNEEPKEKPHSESPSEGSNVQGILQNLGRHLDTVFDTDKDKVNEPVNSTSDLGADSSPHNIQQELEGSGASPQQLDDNKRSMTTTECSVACPEDIASEKLIERAVVNTEVNSCGDGTMAVGGSIQSEADGTIPFEGKGIDPDLVLPGNRLALGHHEVKSHVGEVDLEGKTHSDGGEFYECFGEVSNLAAPALETKLREEHLNNTQHQEASNVGFNLSTPHILEEMGTNTSEQRFAKNVGDRPSQLSHLHNPDTQLCNATEEDKEEIEKQGAEGDGIFASKGHDDKEDVTDNTASPYNLCESEQSGETRDDVGSPEFNEDGENMDPSPTVDQELVKGSAEEEHINASTPINSTEIPVHAGTKLDNNGVLTEGNKNSHEEGLSTETTKQETEVSFLPPSKETSNIELKHDLEPSTQSPSIENTFVEPSEPLGLSDSSGYSKEDTLDRNVKITKSKNKEDCLLS